jgi:hypothetical protein
LGVVALGRGHRDFKPGEDEQGIRGFPINRRAPGIGQSDVGQAVFIQVFLAGDQIGGLARLGKKDINRILRGDVRIIRPFAGDVAFASLAEIVHVIDAKERGVMAGSTS